MIDEFDRVFNAPRVQPYDPPPPASGQMTINLEYQRQDRDNHQLGQVETERTGRARLIIEGELELMKPFLDAIDQVRRRHA